MAHWIIVQRFPVILVMAFALITISASATSGQVSSTTWDKPQQVERKEKPKRVYRPTRKARVRPKVEMSPLLTVQYRVLIKRPDGTQGEASPASVFHPADQLRLGVTANQDGFLYVIYQKENQDGLVMFPDSRVNNGENYVGKNREFILPPVNCPAANPDECWYKVTDDPTKEFFIVVFSRDQILDLPNTAGGTEAVRTALASGVLKKEVIDSYVRSARMQDYKIYSRPATANSPSSRYAIWVTNTNRADNEEVIVRVPLNKAIS
jgi:Domain of unknown function (DUF4384)